MVLRKADERGKDRKNAENPVVSMPVLTKKGVNALIERERSNCPGKEVWAVRGCMKVESFLMKRKMLCSQGKNRWEEARFGGAEGISSRLVGQVAPLSRRRFEVCISASTSG